MAPHTSIGKIRQGISFTCPTWYPWCPGNQVGTQVGQGQVWICHLYQITSEMATLSWTWFNWPIKLQVSYNPSLIHYDLVAVNLDSTMLEVHSWWNWLRWVLNGGGCISRSNADRNWLTNFALDGEVWPSWDPIQYQPAELLRHCYYWSRKYFCFLAWLEECNHCVGAFFQRFFRLDSDCWSSVCSSAGPCNTVPPLDTF